MSKITVAATQKAHFDVATDTTFLGKNEKGNSIYTGVASNKWCIGEVPNVRYVMAIIIDSVLRHFSSQHQTDPVALNCFFFSKTNPGNLIIEIEPLKMSRKGYCVVRAILRQTKDLAPLTSIDSYNSSDWIDKVQGIFTMGNMDSEQGLTYFHKNPPAPSTKHLEPYKYAFMGEFLECSFDKSNFPASETEPGKPEVTQKIGFSDGRGVDFKSIPYWCDMFTTPPSLLGPAVNDGPIWCPTMQLEVLFKNKPKGDKVIAHFVAPHIINGRFDVEGEIYGEDGELFALTRHQCLVVPWSRNSKDSASAERRQAAIINENKSKL